MASTRLPGKVLLPLAGAPMLARQIERLQRAQSMDRLIVATTTSREDDAIASLAGDLGIECHRGSADDVLGRYFRAAEVHAPSSVVRVTADCPLADWTLVDRTVELAVSGGYDYASNTLRPTWPDGLDVEVLTFAALESAWTEARSPVDREHVTQFLLNRPDRFTLGSIESDVDLSALRWTVDEPRDYAFVSRVYDTLYPRDPAFTTEDVLCLLRERPELMEINSGIERNEGLRLSIDKYVKESPGE